MTKSPKLLVALGVVLIVVVVAGVYQYRVEQQRQHEEALVLIETGITRFKQQQYESAVEALRSIPEGVIEDWRLPYYQGASLVQLKDFEAAAVLLEEAWSLNNTEEAIPFALAITYFKLGNLGLSKSYFHSVLEINPDNADAKGLMDIMANLERNQPGEAAEEVTPIDENKEETSQ